MNTTHQTFRSENRVDKKALRRTHVSETRGNSQCNSDFQYIGPCEASNHKATMKLQAEGGNPTCLLLMLFSVHNTPAGATLCGKYTKISYFSQIGEFFWDKDCNCKVTNILNILLLAEEHGGHKGVMMNKLISN